MFGIVHSFEDSFLNFGEHLIGVLKMSLNFIAKIFNKMEYSKNTWTEIMALCISISAFLLADFYIEYKVVCTFKMLTRFYREIETG